MTSNLDVVKDRLGSLKEVELIRQGKLSKKTGRELLEELRRKAKGKKN